MVRFFWLFKASRDLQTYRLTGHFFLLYPILQAQFPLNLYSHGTVQSEKESFEVFDTTSQKIILGTY